MSAPVSGSPDNPSESPCKRCWVSGRVQGVFFRGSARKRARSLGVKGYAANLPDGRVEVLACGRADAVTAFCAWLAHGPSAARVDEVVCVRATEDAPNGFDVR